MATVWLNQNISAWNTPAAWYYWDEDTQSGQPYGQVPQDNDVVYLNGYTIGNLTNANIFCLCHIKNTLNPYTQRDGGYFGIIRSNSLQFKTIEVGNTTMFSGGIAVNYTNQLTAEDIRLTGNGMLYQKTLGGTVAFLITGNIFCTNMGTTLVGSAGGLRCVITGNIYTERLITQVAANDISINGNVSLKNTHVSDNTNELTINGLITLDNAYLGEANTANINGQIEYNNYNPIKGLIRTENLLINDNCAITRLGDIDGSIIKTQYQLDNTDQYPAENEVKEGTEYAWGELVGTYLPGYPPESVVLKDYEYGDSDDRKTGTMENEVIVEVDNTNTINVFPYKRRNNG